MPFENALKGQSIFWGEKHLEAFWIRDVDKIIFSIFFYFLISL